MTWPNLNPKNITQQIKTIEVRGISNRRFLIKTLYIYHFTLATAHDCMMFSLDGYSLFCPKGEQSYRVWIKEDFIANNGVCVAKELIKFVVKNLWAQH